MAVQLKCPECGTVMTLGVDGKAAVITEHVKPDPPKGKKKDAPAPDPDDTLLAILAGDIGDDDGGTDDDDTDE